MKVTVSIPEPLFSKAEQLATRMELSRSEIYAQALEAFVARAAIAVEDSEQSEADEAMIAEAIRKVSNRQAA
ncbi:MAG: hypothetical protein ACRCY3_16055 [Sphingorhabdus sp.]